MLPFIGITAAILFIILWRVGVFEELRRWALSQENEPGMPLRKLLTGKTEDPEMSKRLEVFEEFIDELPDDEDAD